jgi:hypothetical protein
MQSLHRNGKDDPGRIFENSNCFSARFAVPAMPVPWRWNAGLKLIAGFDGDRRRFAR